MKKPQLDYAVTSIPAPLYTQEVGQISIAVSNSAIDAIDLAEVSISLTPGNSADALAVDFTGVKPLSVKGWSIEAIGAGQFRAKPSSGDPQPMGQAGLEFIISDIPVNLEPGTTYVEIVETTILNKVKRQATKDFPLVKTAPSLTLKGPTVEHTAVDYGGEMLISWSATHGATITLAVDGKTIDHVKNQPGTPLPAVGSYMIENFIRADTVVSCTAVLNEEGKPQTKTNQVIISMNPPEIDVFETARVSGHPNTVTASWKTKSAGQVQLAIGDNPAADVAKNGTLPTPEKTSIFATDVTLSVSNPVKTIQKSVPQGPAEGNWIRVADGPDLPADCHSQLFSTGAQIGLLAYSPSMDPLAKLYLSDDVQSWQPTDEIPFAPFVSDSSVVLSTPETTYVATVLSFDIFATKRLGMIWRRDVSTGEWSKSPAFPFSPSGRNSMAMTADDKGAIYVMDLGLDGSSGLFVSKNKGETWVGLTPDNAVNPRAFYGKDSILQWVNGTLWLVGGGGADTTNAFNVAFFDPDAGWNYVAAANDDLSLVNTQSVVWNDTLYLLKNPSLTKRGALQLFKTTFEGQVSSYPPSPDAMISNNDASLATIGFTSFKGMLFASAGPGHLPGGGIWMFNQPDF